MRPSKQIPQETRWRALELHQARCSANVIAWRLGLSPWDVYKIIREARRTPPKPVD